MKVYDCDNPDHFKALEQLEEEKELVKNNQLQSFAPDSLEEARIEVLNLLSKAPSIHF